MSGEILADGNSPMFMTVDQYNERVARTWSLAIADEQARIIKLLEEQLCSCTLAECQVAKAIALIKGDKNE